MGSGVDNLGVNDLDCTGVPPDGVDDDKGVLLDKNKGVLAICENLDPPLDPKLGGLGVEENTGGLESPG